jgi:hypothetical protein
MSAAGCFGKKGRIMGDRGKIDGGFGQGLYGG